MNRIHCRAIPARAMFAMLVLAGLSDAAAQDSFGGQQQAPQQYQQAPQPYEQPPQQYPQPPQQHEQPPQQYQQSPQPYPQPADPYGRAQGPGQPDGQDGMQAPPMRDASNEAQDFGVAPTQQLRPTQQLHAETPTSIPGGRVIGTQQLAQLLQNGQGKVIVLDVYGGPRRLPGAVPVLPAAQGGSFDDQVQQGFGQYLRQITGGDASRMLVLYCEGVRCWSSYNAALRAMKLGYRNVVWYRGGIMAWQQAGLPLQGSNMQGQAQGQGPGR